MQEPGGRLGIELRITPEARRCEIHSTRPVTASQVFIGRTPAETARVLPRLYSICGQAQACACTTALEHALGHTAPTEIRADRAAAVASETRREHLWRILIDWPAALDEPADHLTLARVHGLTRTLLAALAPDADLFIPGARPTATDQRVLAETRDALDTLLEARLFGMPPAHWLTRIDTPERLADWAASGVSQAARLLQRVIVEDLAGLGASTVAPLPALDDRALADLLPRLADPGFLTAPTWDGAPRETTPVTRQHHQPLVRALGTGLLARLVALLVEVADPPLLASRPSGALDDGLGVGRAAAARGMLTHLVQLDARGHIADYCILAPTEWNFHPRGALALALEALGPAPEAELRRRAGLLIAALDPCVAFDLTLSTAGPSEVPSCA
ncbi:Ni,Fe-hydrogenase I large subunit [Marichromatium bheemlicum]|uniref:Ni,Fe-hydrogenase I large subunit n=1 Tax=Marichromatium bheemlicum TaxID=365339 RepID=A0ABX1I955_9GAMM|nr:Ni,Fe-hydrogenase I large subunit [Marichromatium bheemlicum]NKN34085.1 Ni,Fe-hydrogenase I large subunit [Marichromatium bheemlicum]